MATTGAGVDTSRPAGAQPLDCSYRNPFPPGFEQQLASRYPGRHFSARVYDQATGCIYDLAPGRAMTTASVVKLEIMAGVLLRAQRQGRGLTGQERSLISPMITQSANPPASQLFSSLGGTAGMNGVSASFGLGSTSSNSVWGLTRTTAADQIHLVRQVLAGEFGPLAAPYRAEARFYTGNVVASQRWGASAAVPPGWAVFQKNGFAPSQCCGWRLNSVGWVERPGGSGWALAILTDGWATEGAGIDAVQAIGARINNALVASPFGSLDAVTPLQSDQVRVAGWVLDPSATDPSPVHVYVDGRFAAATLASGDRPDVAAAYPGYGAAHGYSTTVSVPDGTHQVCAYALNIGPDAPNPILGCQPVSVRVSPIGVLDSVIPAPAGMRVTGWAWDPDSTAPLPVHVYVDGAFAGSAVADGDRPDVAAGVPGAGPNHGFAFNVNASEGAHTACAYGLNVGPGAPSLLGCLPISVGGPPFGFLDGVTALQAGQVRVTGWVVDPTTTDPVTVHVYVDGRFSAAVLASGDRPDVPPAYPGYGPAHGYATAISVPDGTHQVCVYALNVGPDAPNPILGCRPVTVGALSGLST